MSSVAGPANPSLIAILLVTQARNGSGPKLVFHYPPDPLHPNIANPALGLGSHDRYEESSSSSGDEESSEDETPVPYRDGTTTRVGYGHTSWTNMADEDEDEILAKKSEAYRDKAWEPSWEPLLGLGTDSLVGLLTPDRTWHKRKFEVGINDFCFLGWPVFAKDDGSWKGHKTRNTGSGKGLDEVDQSDADRSGGEMNQLDGESVRDVHERQNGSRRKVAKSDLIMFNVVFVLDPPILEYNLRIKQMYDNVVKKFTRVLKWEQRRSDYVLRESDLIQSIASKHLARQSIAPTMYTELLSRSSLATALSTVFTSISTSRIASITLSPNVSISLQIPPVSSASVLPFLTDPPLQPGLWLTTANEPPDSSDLDIGTQSGSVQLAKHFTLLFKATKARILKDVQSTGGPLALPLTNFVIACNPTKSFYKTSIASKISLEDIQLLARHLIDWRRAIAIPPLNHRDTYVVSPNADMSRLKAASKAYETAFPTLPSLPKILSILSEPAKPWGFLIPSTDHKEAYYEVLAWLMRGGWVTQLRTFALVRVSPEVKKAVREKEEAEKKLTKQAATTKPDDSKEVNTEPSTPRRPSMMSRPSSEAKYSVRTTSTTTSSNPHTTSKPDDPSLSSIIQNPSRASPLEASWLEHLADSLLTTDYRHPRPSTPLSPAEAAELRHYFRIFLKYFNGQEALEGIAVREGMKRNVVWDLLGKMGMNSESGMEREDGAKGWLVTVQHW